MRLRDKTAIITGGASGIGLAAARRFAAEGASVVIGDLDGDKAAAAAAQITGSGGSAVGTGVNVMDEDSIAALIGRAIDEFGSLHVLCNHVGGSNPRKDLDLLRMDMDEFDKVMALNVRSTVLGSRLALPHMIAAGGGSIINTASVGGLSGDYLQSAYGTAKAAVIRLTQYIATQYGPQNVRCNAVAPGAISSPALLDNLSPEEIEAIVGHNSLPFLGEPDDIADTMLFLASNESRYLTGQLLTVDGGMSSHSSIAEDRRGFMPA